MRKGTSPKIGNSAVKLMVAAFLASVATGCSSDATRFSGIFSSDQITTASIPQRGGAGAYGVAPVPRGDVSSGGYASAAPVNQPYPAQSAGYDPMAGATASASPARNAAAPMTVQRSELAAPSAAGADASTRQQAMAQPFPSAPSAAPVVTGNAAPAAADTLTTGTVKPSNGWSTVNAPSVTLRQGETIATLANRYGVPEREILRANGLQTASAAMPGQSIVIPTFGAARNPAKAAADAIDVSQNNQAPAPARQQEQNLAVLPTAATARDKAQAEGAKLTPPGGKPLPPTGGYTVKPGDTLTKIARETNTPVAALKAANGLTTETIRVGQVLKVPGAGDQVTTASIPAKAEAQKPAAQQQAQATAAPKPTETASVQAPAAYKPPVATETVSDVEKKAGASESIPVSTGISKYRWPVRGAVISSFGQNVEGSRNDGIDISVPEGTPIKAAENGVVIYAGNGLKQLGNTVLVRHDDGKVTVYGHAADLNVARGQKVQRGQTLATSGMSGNAKRPQVHFEVRKDATPVNPITFLE